MYSTKKATFTFEVTASHKSVAEIELKGRVPIIAVVVLSFSLIIVSIVVLFPF